MTTDFFYTEQQESRSAARAVPMEQYLDDYRRERKESGVMTRADLPVFSGTSSAGALLNQRRPAIELSPYDRTATVQGYPVELTPLQFQILAHLVRNAGRVVSPGEFASTVFRSAEAPDSSKLRVHIHGLRRRLGALGRLIESVRGKGYRIELRSA